MAGPIFAGISVTQRGAAESFIVCTGVGRKGKEVILPGYQRGRTLIMLMGMARLGPVVQGLTDTSDSYTRRDGDPFPLNTPIALIERASMPDQRVIETTLRDVEAALEDAGEQRPPGMFVVGWAAPALWAEGSVDVLDGDSERDDERVRLWLMDTRWRVREGLPEAWRDL